MPKSRRSRKSRRSTRRVRRGGFEGLDVSGSMPSMPDMPINPVVVSKGGRRKTKRKASSWNKAVKKVYDEMKRKNRNATLGEAMRVASQRKKNGTL